MKVLYKLKEEQRELLAQPLEGIFTGEDIIRKVANADILVSVGDVCSLTLLEAGIQPNIYIIDGKTKRNGEVEQGLLATTRAKEVRVENPQAVITNELWEAIADALNNCKEVKYRVVVDGEEDLASLPVIALAPKGTIVIYGMPDKGIALIKVSPYTKEQVNLMLRMMEA